MSPEHYSYGPEPEHGLPCNYHLPVLTERGKIYLEAEYEPPAAWPIPTASSDLQSDSLSSLLDCSVSPTAQTLLDPKGDPTPLPEDSP